MKDRIQLTSDGLTKYKDAVEQAFGMNVDYARLTKSFEKDPDKAKNESDIAFTIKERMCGNPDPIFVSTSLVERQNLTMRTNIKRFARRTNAHSKKIENHGHAVALHFMYYNFARIHSSLRVSPAMAAKITDKLWSIEDIVDMADGF